MAESIESESDNSVSASENAAVETESENSRLPCKKTLTLWAKSKFQLWLDQKDGSSQSEPLWAHKKSKFTAEQVISWFEFKDKKYWEAADIAEEASIDGVSETLVDRQFFGCTAMFHKDPAFISIFSFKKPLATVVGKTGEKRKRYSNEFMFLPNSSDNIVAYPSSGLHQPRQESQPILSQRLPQ